MKGGKEEKENETDSRKRNDAVSSSKRSGVTFIFLRLRPFSRALDRREGGDRNISKIGRGEYS